MRKKHVCLRDFKLFVLVLLFPTLLSLSVVAEMYFPSGALHGEAFARACLKKAEFKSPDDGSVPILIFRGCKVILNILN